MPDTPTSPDPQRGLILKFPFPWFYATRTLGAMFLVYGLFADHTPERGTIILTGAGLIGVERAARSDKHANGGGG